MKTVGPNQKSFIINFIDFQHLIFQNYADLLNFEVHSQVEPFTEEKLCLIKKINSILNWFLDGLATDIVPLCQCFEWLKHSCGHSKWGRAVFKSILSFWWLIRKLGCLNKYNFCSFIHIATQLNHLKQMDISICFTRIVS